MQSKSLLALAALAGISAASQAQAGGFYLQEQSTRGAGRAYSGEVADQGVQSLWWNPAAIARSGREVYVGAHGVLIDTKTRDTGSTITYPGGLTTPVSGEPRAFQPIHDGLAPNFAIAAPFGDRFAVGLSVAAPYNFTTEYGPKAWARYDALKSELQTVDVQLTGAVKVTDWLDLGVGADAQYTDATLATAYPNLSPLLADGASRLTGDGWNYGWTVGAQAYLGDWSFGASYRSAMDHDLDGRVQVTGLVGPLAGANQDVNGSASFTTPWIATLGARWKVTDKLTLNAQAQRFGWSEFDAIRVKTAGGTQILAQGYKDTTSGALGLDYALNDRLTLRTGVQYDPTPTPDGARTARVPDGDRWLYSAGATAQLNPSLKMDVAATYIAFDDSAIAHDTTFYEGTPAAVTTRLRGQVEGTGAVLSVGLRQTF